MQKGPAHRGEQDLFYYTDSIFYNDSVLNVVYPMENIKLNCRGFESPVFALGTKKDRHLPIFFILLKMRHGGFEPPTT